MSLYKDVKLVSKRKFPVEYPGDHCYPCFLGEVQKTGFTPSRFSVSILVFNLTGIGKQPTPLFRESRILNQNAHLRDLGSLRKLRTPAFATLFMILFPLFFASFSPVSTAQGATVGLSIGQWAHYSLSGNESAGTVDALFTVQNINGPNVTLTDLDTFQDGHTSTDALVISTLTGPATPASGEYFVISPQKTIGESVYPGDYHYNKFPIQDITARTYASARRQTAHVQGMNSSQICAPAPCTPPPCPNPACTSEDFYWDQATGMFTEIIKTVNGATVLHVAMTTTSMWPPESPIDPYIVPSAIISLSSAILIAIIVVARYRKKLKRSR